MHNKRLLMVLLSFLSLLLIPLAQAPTITVCTFDKDAYNQGETGYITVAIYNDEEIKIRVTELTATINHYYDDGNIYIQKFYSDATFPAEIQQGNSSSFYIPFSLPTNIASGYTNVHVKAVTELWNEEAERWFGSEHPTYEPKLYIESPYKQQSEDYQQQLEEEQMINTQLEEQLEEQLTVNTNTTNVMYLFGVTTIVLAAASILLFILYKRARFFTQPMA